MDNKRTIIELEAQIFDAYFTPSNNNDLGDIT